MRKTIFAVLMVMSSLIIGGLFYMPGIFASHTVETEVGVRVFRIEDINTRGGRAAPNQNELIEGAESELERTADGISMEIETNGLPEGTYTVWWVIDNDNDDTTGAFPDPPVGMAGIEIIRRGTEGIVGANGEGEFEATLPAAPVPAVNDVTVLFNVGGNQVLNPLGARVAMVLRFHGPVVPGGVLEQTTLFAGGCDNIPLIDFAGAFPAGEGHTCFNPQITEFHVP